MLYVKEIGPSFLFLAEQYTIISIYQVLFVHSLVDRHLDYLE
jgi:hypothetical protein